MVRLLLPCLLALGLLLAAPVAAQERRVALVMAAEAYRTLRPLANPVSDAMAMQAVLEGLGFEVFVELNRDARRMRRALEDFAEDAAGADVAALFFAGHGMEIGGRNYLLPVDAPAESAEALAAGAVPLEEVVETLRAVAPVALVILDACRDDPFGAAAGDATRGAVAMGQPPADVRLGLGRVGRADGLLFAFAAAPGATALDGTGGNSPFTGALARYLGTEGLEVRSALTLVQQEVYDRTRGAQLPYVESGLPRLFFAAEAAGPLDERERLLLAMAELTPALRAEVEAVAAARAMPLAPLYAALLSADLAGATPEDRRAALAEAAEAHARFLEDLRRFASDDPRVQALRAEAEAQVTLGAFEAARARLTEAAAIDAASREGLRANLLARTVSEAGTHALNGAAAWADLRYGLAIGDYARAAALFDEAGGLGELAPEARLGQLVALQSLATLHAATGDLEAALPVAARLVAVAEARLATDPDRVDWLIDLAIALRRQGDLELAAGDLRRAFDAYSTANDVDVRVLDLDPGSFRGLRGFIIGLNKLGDIYRMIDEPGFARTSYGHALDLAEMLAASDPDDPQLADDVAVGLTKLGDVSLALGDLAAAAGYAERALALAEALSARDPGAAEPRRGLGIALERRGSVALMAGDAAGAEAVFARALELRAALAAEDPARSLWQSDLAVILGKLGDALARQGRLHRALEHHAQALEILRRLAAQDARNAALRRALMVSLNDVGALAAQLGDRAAARSAFAEAMEIARALVAQDPANAVWQRDLAVSHNLLGDLARDSGDLDAAEAHYRDALERVAGRAAGPDAPAEALDDLAIAHERLGDLAQLRGDPAAALQDYAAALALREQLLARDPSRPGWRRNLAVSHNRVGDMELALGRPEAALQDFAAAQSLAEALLAEAPNTPGPMGDLSLALAKRGTALAMVGEIAAAYAEFQRSQALLDELVAALPDHPWYPWERIVRGWQLSETAPDSATGLAHLAEAVARAEALRDAGRMPPEMAEALAFLTDELRRRAD